MFVIYYFNSFLLCYFNGFLIIYQNAGWTRGQSYCHEVQRRHEEASAAGKAEEPARHPEGHRRSRSIHNGERGVPVNITLINYATSI